MKKELLFINRVKLDTQIIAVSELEKSEKKELGIQIRSIPLLTLGYQAEDEKGTETGEG